MSWNLNQLTFQHGWKGLAVAVLVAAQMTGCGWYVKPTCSRDTCPPMMSDSGSGYGAAGDMAGESGFGSGYGSGYGDWDGNLSDAGKTRFSGEAQYMLDTVYFDFDRSSIRGDQQLTLERNLAWIQQNPKSLIRIEGHCDERGTEQYNLALGDRRADSIRSWLINRGVAPSRIQTVSKGELEPAVIGHDEATWSLNRRAEFLILE